MVTYNVKKRAGVDFFHGKPRESERVKYCIMLFYRMFPERDYLPGSFSVEKPFTEDTIEKYIMKDPSNYDTMDIINIIQACDEEYIKIKVEMINKMNSSKK